MQQQKTYRLMTKDRMLVNVPRSGNHAPAIMQGMGYGTGYGIGLFAALVLEPAVGLIKDTNFARGVQHGFVEAHRTVDVRRRTSLVLRSDEVDAGYKKLLERGQLTKDQNVTPRTVAVMVAEHDTPQSFPFGGFRSRIDEVWVDEDEDSADQVPQDCVAIA